MAKKLSARSSWRAIGKLEKSNDPDFVISPGLIDLPNADALASTSARDPPKQESCTGFQKYVTKGTRSIRRCTHYTTQS